MDLKVLSELKDEELRRGADKFRQHYQAMLDIRAEFAQLGLFLHVKNPAGGPPIKTSSFPVAPEKYTFKGETKIVREF